MSQVGTFDSARVWNVAISHIIENMGWHCAQRRPQACNVCPARMTPVQPQNLPIFSPMTCRRSGTPWIKDNQGQDLPAGQKFSILVNRLTQNINIYIYIRKPGVPHPEARSVTWSKGQLTPGGSIGPGHLLEEMINTRKPGWQNDNNPEARMVE